MERLLKKELAPISEFENQLQYGITLAELAKLFSEESVKKIFEVLNEQNKIKTVILQLLIYNKIVNEIYKYINILQSDKLQFRHSDNINYFFDALRNIKFPEVNTKCI